MLKFNWATANFAAESLHKRLGIRFWVLLCFIRFSIRIRGLKFAFSGAVLLYMCFMNYFFFSATAATSFAYAWVIFCRLLLNRTKSCVSFSCWKINVIRYILRSLGGIFNLLCRLTGIIKANLRDWEHLATRSIRSPLLLAPAGWEPGFCQLLPAQPCSVCLFTAFYFRNCSLV